jgi:hypothetical protein
MDYDPESMDSGLENSWLIQKVNNMMQNKYFAIVLVCIPFCVTGFIIAIILSLHSPPTVSPDLMYHNTNGSSSLTVFSATKPITRSSLVPRQRTQATTAMHHGTVRTSAESTTAMPDTTEKPDPRAKELEIQYKMLQDLIDLNRTLNQTMSAGEAQSPDGNATVLEPEDETTTQNPDTSSNEYDDPMTDTTTTKSWRQRLDDLIPQINW